MLNKLPLTKIALGVAVLAILFIGARFYQEHRENMTWCVTHEVPCRISRLQNAQEELLKINEIEPLESP